MNILCIQHVPFEGPAALAEWSAARGHILQSVLAPTSFAEDAEPPSDFDAVFVMGGPLSANDAFGLPWMAEEMEFLRKQIDKGIRILGVCLGAQILTVVLGGAVTANGAKEIGWYPVTAVTDHPLLPIAAGATVSVFHWHGETFSIPDDATHLLRSELCRHQAYIWNDQVLALQCHPEMTTEGIAALTAQSHDELQVCGIPVDGSTLHADAASFQSSRELLFYMLDRFFVSSTNGM